MRRAPETGRLEKHRSARFGLCCFCRTCLSSVLTRPPPAGRPWPASGPLHVPLCLALCAGRPTAGSLSFLSDGPSRGKQVSPAITVGLLSIVTFLVVFRTIIGIRRYPSRLSMGSLILCPSITSFVPSVVRTSNSGIFESQSHDLSKNKQRGGNNEHSLSYFFFF